VRTSDFDYDLPSEMIAQRPAEPRDSSRLMLLDRKTGALSHHIFRDLPKFLSPGDALVLNETRVIPARLMGRKIPTGGRVELLLLRRLSPQTWEALVGGKGVKAGQRIDVCAKTEAEILEELEGPLRVVHFAAPISPLLEEVGEMPLPPYIHTPLRKREEYQSVFARYPGSSAAPTAGLHFTPQLIEGIESQGVRLIKITLHVGLDTFAPVREGDPEHHKIHSEWCQVSSEAAQALNATKESGKRIVAVGTTSTRALESAARRSVGDHLVGAFEGPTDLFILPGFRFQAVDAMVTNFHLPRSTLLMMISAFAGRESILHAYDVAKAEDYRFYSFGDAMLIL
jgi:S-adenosylmethionine:tRNA ribosyltransferase-isomerase